MSGRAAVADGTLTPYAAEDIEYNTNVFDIPSGSAAPLGKHGPTYADTFFEERAGVEGTYLIDQERFFGTAEFRRFDYQDLTELSHNEELFDGGLKWKLSRLLDGTVEYRHEQRMVQFQDVTASTSLILETENTANLAFNVNVTPEWRLETAAKDHVLDSPRNDVPGLSLHEDSVREGLRYLGVTNLSAGVDAGYLEGKYRNDPLALTPNYHQFSANLAAAYTVSGLTNFNGTLGYTKRVDPTNAGLSGITGSLGYLHSLSGKTSLSVLVNRELSTYLTTGGNEIDTTASTSLNWQVTYKIGLKAGYGYTLSKYPENPDGALFIERTDHFQTANVEATYQVLHWLSIRPYARYQTRHSNVPLNSFNSNMVGVELLVKQFRPAR
jgi:hypothetical protein